MQHFLKSPHRAAGAEIFAAKFFEKLHIAMHEADAALDPGFGRERFAAFAHRLKRRGARLRCVSWSWQPPANSVERQPYRTKA